VQTKTVEIRETALPAPALDGAQLASLIRGVVREEMGRVQPAATAVQEKEPVRAEPSVEQVEAHERGQDLVAAAQRTGHWTSEDRHQLRALMSQLSATDRDDLLHTLIPAINRQEVKVDLVGPPF